MQMHACAHVCRAQSGHAHHSSQPFSTTKHAAPNPVYLTMEHGWSISQPSSWGAEWHRRALNEAIEQLKSRVADMANIETLIVSSSSSDSDKVNVTQAVSAAKALVQASGAIGVSSDSSTAESMHRTNRNNFIIFVDHAEIVPGSDWSKTECNWKGERSWQASLRIRAVVGIYLPTAMSG
jgi:hypothetical protein